jgi:hypothetical protein
LNERIRESAIHFPCQSWVASRIVAGATKSKPLLCQGLAENLREPNSNERISKLAICIPFKILFHPGLIKGLAEYLLFLLEVKTK